MGNYVINTDIEQFERVDIKNSSDISDSIVIIVLNSSTNNKLFDYYSAVKDLIINRNRVLLLIDGNTTNIDKQISMLMISYAKYDIYRIEDMSSLDFEYVAKLIDREPTREEIEQFIGCDISMYDKINSLLAEMCSLFGNIDELGDFIVYLFLFYYTGFWLGR